MASPTSDAPTGMSPAASPSASPTAGSPTEALPGVTTSVVVRKLITKEDPQHFHKVLGLFAVCSFAYRYLYVWPTTGTLGFVDGSPFDWFTVAMHCLLSCSSLIFRVPIRRIRKLPTVIYEEYRQHAMLFTLRAGALFALAILLPTAGAAVRYVVCMMWHVMADMVTAKWGTPGETAVRGKDRTTRWNVYLIRRIYASYQFIAIGSCLVPHVLSADLGWNSMIAIQSSAFLMTLRKKGLVRWQTHAVWYTICLGLSTGYLLSLIGSPLYVGTIAFLFMLRSQLGINKYLLWAFFAFLAHQPAFTASMLSPSLSASLPGIAAKMPATLVSVPVGKEALFFV
eukprot:TRINITY_DN22270_c0_g1_i1.p1 TRINITY_DN22270_c0_g1~~TRINITY_DN22270_c0_g1_i1.p1  ORF type:complete len:365 (-),score=66.28 TRINITY_DN22270_c0_g1_i1:200-1219(-)